MSNDGQPLDDPIAAAILSNSPYEQLRATGSLRRSIAAKVGTLGVLLAALTVSVPLVMTRTPVMQALYRGESPLASTPIIATLGAIGCVLALASGVTLGLIVAHQARLGETLSRTQARTLLAIEDVASMFGFGGGVLTLVTMLTFVGCGLSGPDAATAIASGPFTTSLVGISVESLVAIAAAGSLLLVAMSVYIHRRRSST